MKQQISWRREWGSDSAIVQEQAEVKSAKKSWADNASREVQQRIDYRETHHKGWLGTAGETRQIILRYADKNRDTGIGTIANRILQTWGLLARIGMELQMWGLQDDSDPVVSLCI